MTELTAVELFSTEHVEPEYNQILVAPLVHGAEMPDKSLWSKLLRALNFWMKAPKDKFNQISNILRMIKTIKHVNVDLEEMSLTRNGAATSISVYNIDESLASVVHGLFIVMEKVNQLERPEALEMVMDQQMAFRKGREMEMFWRDHEVCPTEEEYFKMADYKTGSFIRMTIQLLQLFSKDTDDFTNLGNILTRFIHVYDDYVTIRSMDEYIINKDGYDGISEGRISFPIVHATKTGKDNRQIINILGRKSTNKHVLEYCEQLLEQNECFDYTKQVLIKLKQDAEEEMEKLDENPYMVQLFEHIFSKLNINV